MITKTEKRHKLGATISILFLNKTYGKHALQVLADHIEEKPRKRRQQRSYELLKELPSQEEYDKLRSKKYETTISSLVSDAFSGFENLASELREWYDNLPDSFQQGDKGSTLDEAATTLEGLNQPDIGELGENKLVFLPDLNITSRSARNAEACDMLNTVINWLQENHKIDGAEDLESELESAVSDAENVEFPGMY